MTRQGVRFIVAAAGGAFIALLAEPACAQEAASYAICYQVVTPDAAPPVDDTCEDSAHLNLGKIFPVWIDSVDGPSKLHHGRRNYFSASWLAGLLQRSEKAGYVQDLPTLASQIRKVNLAFYENGYVNSGVKIHKIAEPDGARPGKVHLHVVVGRSQLAAGHDKGLEAYASARLREDLDRGGAFNVYVLERNFRRLGQDRQISRVNVDLQPTPKAGIAEIAPRQAEAEPRTHARLVEPQPALQTWITVSNDRAPSVGRVRQAAGLAWRWPLAAVTSEMELGETEGAADGQASVTASMTSAWRVTIQGAASDAAVIEPALRVLDIEAKSRSAQFVVSYGLVRCPLMPLYGPAVGEARRERSGRLGCLLPVRVSGDVPAGWGRQRDVAVSLSLSHRETKTYLMGQLFSFSPGAVNGRSEVLAARLQVDWLESGRIGHRGESGWTLAGRVSVAKGLSGTFSPQPSPLRPSPHFSSLNFQWSGAAEISPWKSTLVIKGVAQWTNGPLYTSERLPLGGSGSVRGYAEAAMLTDEGWGLTAEVSRVFTVSDVSPRLARKFHPGSFRAGIFVATAEGRNYGPEVAQPNHLSSGGMILAWMPRPSMTLELSWARSLTDDGPAARTLWQDDGLSFRLEYRPKFF